MIARQAAKTLKRLENGFPVICITGPRQSGKTTLSRATFPEKPNLSLEDPDIARLAKDDPRGLLDSYRDGLILDEAQAVPQIFAYLLKPYHRSFGKRLVKRPKLFFVDTGLASRLLGIRTAEELFVHPNRGNLFESFVVAELLKIRYNQGLNPDIFFWRDSSGTEVDVVFEEGPTVKAIEIKSGKTFSPEHASGLEVWMRYSGAAPGDSALIFAGDRRMKRHDVAVLPWDSAGGILDPLPRGV